MVREEQSKRAFALDSRTVWVEQANVKGMLLPIENSSLGPAEYSPHMIPQMTKHVGTPSLGKRGKPDNFHPFRSSVSRGGSSPTGRIRGGIASEYSITDDRSMGSLAQGSSKSLTGE